MGTAVGTTARPFSCYTVTSTLGTVPVETAQTIPMLMAIDEMFDIGADTRTGVDNEYELSFQFTGTVEKLTYELCPSQVMAAQQREAEEQLSRARD